MLLMMPGSSRVTAPNLAAADSTSDCGFARNVSPSRMGGAFADPGVR